MDKDVIKQVLLEQEATKNPPTTSIERQQLTAPRNLYKSTYCIERWTSSSSIDSPIGDLPINPGSFLSFYRFDG